MSETFEFIDAEYAHGSAQNIPTVRPSVAAMCAWLGVSRSGYYAWRDRPESATARRREELKHLIIVSFEESDGTYGYRRVHADLAAWRVTCGPELVRSLTRELGLVPCQPRPWRHSLTDNDGQDRLLPDLVGRDFTAEAPGQKMVGDITYIPTWQGWLYLATVIDCHTREIVGWAMDDLYRPDIPALARAIGAHGVVATTADDIAWMASQALTADRPTVIHYQVG